MLVVESNTSQIQTFIRILSFTFIGAVVTFMLFVLMYNLIKSDQVDEIPANLLTVPSVIYQEPPVKVITKDKVKPLVPIKSPPRYEQTLIDLDDDPGLMTDYQQVKIDEIEFTTDFGPTIVDRDVSPIVRVPPSYPQVAASKGIEGWVRLSFTINDVGGVEDVTVLDSSPKRVFDKAAKRALSRWKYKPRIEHGEAIVRTGLSVVLEFSLEQ